MSAAKDRSKYRTIAPPPLALRKRRPICDRFSGDRHHSCTLAQVRRYFLFSKPLLSGHIWRILLEIFRSPMNRQGLRFAQD
jgi:hypothetical protein